MSRPRRFDSRDPYTRAAQIVDERARAHPAYAAGLQAARAAAFAVPATLYAAGGWTALIRKAFIDAAAGATVAGGAFGETAVASALSHEAVEDIRLAAQLHAATLALPR
jgi:transketolase C-terminal domain/subunit